MRTVKTASGATAMQIVYSSHRGSRDIEHIGSAHDDGELELLKAAVRQRLAAGQGELDLGLDTAAGGAASGGTGAALLVFGFLGSWFLIREIQFGSATERLAQRLDDEGALGWEDLDALPRFPGGRVDRAATDRLFERRRAETEASPQDWRAWDRLAAAYSAAKGSSRARAAMRHAIQLYEGALRTPRPQQTG